MPIGLIGGSGLYQIEGLRVEKEVPVSTPYGSPSAHYTIGSLAQKVVVFLPRHGLSHAIPPHKINYRANIWGFKSLGIERVLSVGAVGSIHRDVPPGTLVVPDQIIDMTGGGRVSTFFDGDKVVHVDFTHPYCPEVREVIVRAAQKSGIPIRQSGTYVCVNGPRLETAREIQFFSQIGADVVGMTAMPEAVLAREAELCLAGITVVTNYAAGISEQPLSASEVISGMKDSMETLKLLVSEAVSLIRTMRKCPCKHALRDASA